MAKRPTLIDITAGFGSNTQHNANNDAIETAFDNTLSRDGSTPNQMEADFDLNSFDLLNGGTLNADDIVVAGTSLIDQVNAAAASATAAASSETAAAASAASAEAALDDFDDLWLGAKASAPTTDNDGDALQAGAAYFNTTSDTLFVWSGSAWVTSSDYGAFTSFSDTPSSYTGEGNKFVRVKATEDGLEFASSTGTEPSDGDKGDITVSASGLTWSIDAGVVDAAKLASSAVTTTKVANDAVTYAKIQNVSATSRILGRKTAGAGDVEEATLSEVLDFIGSAAEGDILYRGASAWARLPKGANGEVLTLAAGLPSWAAAGSSETLQSAVDLTNGGANDLSVANLDTSIPSTKNQIEVVFENVSLSGTDLIVVQVGNGSFVTTGYTSKSGDIASEGAGEGSTSTVGFLIAPNNANSTFVFSGKMTLNKVTGNTWVATMVAHNSGSTAADYGVVIGSGRIALGGALDRVRITVTGTNTFDGGNAAVRY